jgi:hypothetical protein
MHGFGQRKQASCTGALIANDADAQEETRDDPLRHAAAHPQLRRHSSGAALARAATDAIVGLAAAARSRSAPSDRAGDLLGAPAFVAMR